MEEDDVVRDDRRPPSDSIAAALADDGRSLYVDGLVTQPAVLSGAFVAVLAGEDLGVWVVQCLVRGAEALAAEVRARCAPDGVAQRLAAVDPFQAPSPGRARGST